MPPLQDGICEVGQTLLQTVTEIDAGDTSADDDNVVGVLALGSLPRHGLCGCRGEDVEKDVVAQSSVV